MKRILTLALLSSSVFFSSCESTGKDYVYICDGGSSTKYHRIMSCSCVGTCSTDIRKVKLSEAQSMGRGQCGCCYWFYIFTRLLVKAPFPLRAGRGFLIQVAHLGLFNSTVRFAVRFLLSGGYRKVPPFLLRKCYTVEHCGYLYIT